MITRTYETLNEDQLRRNILTIRFRDDEHKAVCDEAWRNRMSMSAWLRDAALSKLAEAGVTDIK